jgi:glycine hydroxymethyltransferase
MSSVQTQTIQDSTVERRCPIDSAIGQELCEIWGVSDRELTTIDQNGYDGGLARADPELFRMFVAERKRQQETLELIASENYVSAEVLSVQGSILTNKYAEGYPGNRYYGGCEFVDVAENLAIDRARALFGAEHANVQPHSGSQANAAVYLALLQLGDTVMAMRLDHGGHLTHGKKINFSGQLYDFVHYGVDRQREQIDYDQVRELALAHRPRMLLAGASAYSRLINFPRLREIADEVSAYLVVDMAHIAGLVAGGVHPSPVPYAHVVTTTTHKTLRGPRGGLILCTKDLAGKIDKAVFPGIQGGPLMHTIAAKAVALRLAATAEFRMYARHVVENAQVLADGLQAEGVRIVSGGTDNHMMLIDVSSVGLSGQEAEEALEEAGIATNKNQIPYDPMPPRVTSGVRIGTPAVTTRGMGVPEMRLIARWIARVLEAPGDRTLAHAVREEVRRLCERFPVPVLGPQT